jgi:methionine-gamma-lyase
MDKKFALQGFGSAAIHAGHQQDPLYSHQTPIYASSTFIFDTAEQGMKRFSGQEEGYIYSRWGNPTFTEAEQKIAALETFEYRSKRNFTCLRHGSYFHLVSLQLEKR